MTVCVRSGWQSLLVQAAHLPSTRDTEDLHSQAIAVKSPTADGDRVVELCESFDGGFEDHSLPHTD
jgi:hypothetical protein